MTHPVVGMCFCMKSVVKLLTDGEVTVSKLSTNVPAQEISAALI
jgi:hypothetical protein